MRVLVMTLSILAVIIITAGCGGNTGTGIKGIAEREIAHPKNTPEFKLNRLAYNHFVNASLLEAMGQAALANQQYLDALKYYPESDVIRLAYANTFFLMGDVARALEEGVKIKDRNEATWQLLGRCFTSLEMHDSAVAAYKNVVAVNSSNVEAYYRLALLYQNRSDLDSTMWAYTKTAQLSPSPQVLNRLANVQIQAGLIDEAEESLRQSVQLDSTAENVNAHINLAVIYENKKDYMKAETYLKRARTLVPSDIGLGERLLEYYRRRDNQTGALGIARDLNKLAPNDNLILRQLALLLYDNDSLTAADSAFDALVSEGDTSIINLYYAGRLAMIHDDYDRARIHFENLTEVADSVVDGWLNLGAIYRLNDSVDQELSIYETGIKYMRNLEDSVRLLFAGGVTLERNGYFDRAVERFEEAVQLDPNHSQALNYLGYMLADKGIRLDEARDMIERALKKNPESGAYLDSYGWVLYKLGDLDQAMDYLLRAYQYVNDDPVILDHIGDVYRAMGERKKAEDFWKSALEIDPDNKVIREKITE